jgi:hypothetical protein
MFIAVYELKEIGKFDTFPQAFKAIYDRIRETPIILWQILETCVWIKEDGDNNPVMFCKARDRMCEEGYLVNSTWVDKQDNKMNMAGYEAARDRYEPINDD